MDPTHAAAMLAQMQSGMNSAVKMERSQASMLPMNPLVAAAACMPQMPQSWPAPFGWHPSLWSGAVNPYANPLLSPAAAAAAAQLGGVSSASGSAAAMVPTLERKAELPKKQRMSSPDADSPHKSRAIEVMAKKTSCGPHSGTQRRPLREEFDDDAEYCQAYHRWRQVRDRNNDAVKRSREKYKSKRKSNEPSSTRERELEQKLGNLQCQLVLLARALTSSGGPLSPLEQAEVQLVLKATLATMEHSMHAEAAHKHSENDSMSGERTSPIMRVPAEAADHSGSPNTGADGSMSESSGSSSHASDVE